MNWDEPKILSKHLFIPINYSIRSIWPLYTFVRVCLSVAYLLFLHFLDS